MAAAILDQFGKPIQSRGLYALPSQHPQDSRPRPIVRPKIYENNTARERWEQVNYSMVIAARVPNIDVALQQQANFSVGDAWHVQYNGTDEAFGDALEAFINEIYYADCNSLGDQHDFHSTLKQLCNTLSTQADYAAVFDDATGKAHFLDYSQIGTGADSNGKNADLEQCKELGNAGQSSSYCSGWGWSIPVYVIKDPASPFFGQRIIDGRIVDDRLRPLGLRVLGFDDEGKPTYCDLPTSRIHFNFEAHKWLKQLRGIPSLANLIDDCNAAEDAKYYWEQAVLNSASRAVTRVSRDGKPNIANIQETEIDVPQLDGTNKKFTVRTERNAAGIYELSSDNGEELKTLDFNRPAPGERELVKQLETGYLAKHWPRGLIYTEDMDRAAGRAITQQVRSIVWSKQRTLERTARWWINRKIAHAMRTGELPKNNRGADAYNYEFTLPGEFTIDEGYDGKLQMTLLGRCCITRGIIANKQGLQEKKLLRANKTSVKNLALAAEELSNQFPWLTPLEALNRLDNNGNPNVQSVPAPTNNPNLPQGN